MVQTELRLVHRGLGLRPLRFNRSSGRLGEIEGHFRRIEIALRDELLGGQVLRALVLLLGVRHFHLRVVEIGRGFDLVGARLFEL